MDRSSISSIETSPSPSKSSPKADRDLIDTTLHERYPDLRRSVSRFRSTAIDELPKNEKEIERPTHWIAIVVL